jgi:hypothetical protein
MTNFLSLLFASVINRRRSFQIKMEGKETMNIVQCTASIKDGANVVRCTRKLYVDPNMANTSIRCNGHETYETIEELQCTACIKEGDNFVRCTRSMNVDLNLAFEIIDSIRCNIHENYETTERELFERTLKGR